MYQVIVEKNGRKLFANCTFEQVSETVSRAEKANMTVLDVLCKKTVGVRPSDADMPRGNGYYKGTPEGWISAKDSTIDGLGYTVKFDMLGERHIDMMCDALNGWECVYSKVKCVFKDEHGELSVTVPNAEKADRIWDVVAKMQKDEENTEAHNVRVAFESIINFVAEKKYTIYKVNFVGYTTDYDYRLEDGLNPKDFNVGDWVIVETTTNGDKPAIIVGIEEQTVRQMKYKPENYIRILRHDEEKGA